MTKRISKRHTITCIKCGNTQSTYSTNRKHCHTCLPKCKERHTFENLATRKQVQEENK